MKKAKTLIASQSGMTLIEIMIAIAISSIVILASISIGNMTTNLQSQNNFSFQADMIRRNMVALILSNSAWQNTINADPSMNCLTPSGGACTPFNATNTITAIYDGSNQLAYNVSAGHGFNLDGTSCNASCPLAFTVQWTPMCQSGGPGCMAPQVKVEIKAVYTPPAASTGKNQMVINEANYSATLYR